MNTAFKVKKHEIKSSIEKMDSYEKNKNLFPKLQSIS